MSRSAPQKGRKRGTLDSGRCCFDPWTPPAGPCRRAKGGEARREKPEKPPAADEGGGEGRPLQEDSGNPPLDNPQKTGGRGRSPRRRSKRTNGGEGKPREVLHDADRGRKL